MSPEEKRRRFRALAKRAPVKTARQLEAERAQLELDLTPARHQPARRPATIFQPEAAPLQGRERRRR
jgi:hypothetical protein